MVERQMPSASLPSPSARQRTRTEVFAPWIQNEPLQLMTIVEGVASRTAIAAYSMHIRTTARRALEEHLVRVQAEYDCAAFAYEAARERLELARAVLQTFRSKCDGYPDRKIHGTYALLNLPSEPLALIFKFSCNLSSVPLIDLRPGGTDLLAHRASTPFVLAAVCRQWRIVALGIAPLWSFIYLPSTGCNSISTTLNSLFAVALVQYATLVLERSNTHPLDIAVDWRVAGTFDFDIVLADLIHLVSAHAYRWRILEVICSSSTGGWLDALHIPTPQLERLVFILTKPATYGARDYVPSLKISPKLEELYLKNIPLAPYGWYPLLEVFLADGGGNSVERRVDHACQCTEHSGGSPPYRRW